MSFLRERWLVIPLVSYPMGSIDIDKSSRHFRLYWPGQWPACLTAWITQSLLGAVLLV
jgi:hypothetical protein